LNAYIQWHINRTPERAAGFENAKQNFTEAYLEFKDIPTLSAEDWKDLDIEKGIKMALKRKFAEFMVVLNTEKARGSSSGSNSSHGVGGGVSEEEADLGA
jgi:hypothetical protein